MRERADRIEADIAPELQPDLVTDAIEHRRLHAGIAEQVRKPRDIFADFAGGFADRKTVAIDMLDDAGSHNFGGGVDDGADCALGPSLRQTRPFLRESTPVIKNEIRPFTRAALPTVKQLRPAMRNLAAATPDLTRVFKVVNYLLNEVARQHVTVALSGDIKADAESLRAASE